MRFQSKVVVEMLQGLEREFGAHRGFFADVASALRMGRYAAAHEATHKLLHVLGMTVAMTARLHANVVPIDGMGEPVESIDELVLRACEMVIVAQLGHVRETLRDPTARERAQGWFVGRFRSIDDVVTYVHDQRNRLNRIWTPYRRGGVQVGDLSDSGRATLYRASVRVAQRQLRELRDDSDLAYFVERGLAATDWADMHTACTEIVAALAVHIDADPAHLPLSSPRLHAVASPPPPRTADAPPARKP